MPMGTFYITSVSRLKMRLAPEYLVSPLLVVLCDLTPPTSGNSTFKECSGVTPVMLQINGRRLFDYFGK